MPGANVGTRPAVGEVNRFVLSPALIDRPVNQPRRSPPAQRSRSHQRSRTASVSATTTPTCTTGRRGPGPRANPSQGMPPAARSTAYRDATSRACQTALTWRPLPSSARAFSRHSLHSASVVWTVHVTVSSRTLVPSPDARPAGVDGRSGTGTSCWVPTMGAGTVRICSKRRRVPRRTSAGSTDTRTSNTV